MTLLLVTVVSSFSGSPFFPLRLVWDLVSSMPWGGGSCQRDRAEKLTTISVGFRLSTTELSQGQTIKILCLNSLVEGIKWDFYHEIQYWWDDVFIIVINRKDTQIVWGSFISQCSTLQRIEYMFTGQKDSAKRTKKTT